MQTEIHINFINTNPEQIIINNGQSGYIEKDPKKSNQSKTMKKKAHFRNIKKINSTNIPKKHEDQIIYKKGENKIVKKRKSRTESDDETDTEELDDIERQELEYINEMKNQNLEDSPYKSTFVLYKNLFDKCFKQYRFDTYDEWIKVGMAINNVYHLKGFPLFNYYSSKGTNYDGTEKTLDKFLTFQHMENGYTMRSVQAMAKQDNLSEYKKIIRSEENIINMEDAQIAMKIKELAGDRFISKRVEKRYVIYSHNGFYWEESEAPLIMFIIGGLHEYYKRIIKAMTNIRLADLFEKQIKKLQRNSSIDAIVKIYRTVGIHDGIEFDGKSWLLGFNNLVYDLREGDFRLYKINDYVSITTCYGWRDPTYEELNTMNRLIQSIMPIEEERKLYLQILCTTLEGKCLEKFTVFNGSGGNGKGMINDMLMVALGDYAMVGNNALLFEKSKTGANPEKANLMKKRFVVFRESPEKRRFENSIIKELTGGGKIGARGLFQSDAQQKLHSTLVVECNKKPLFSEDPTDAEARRLIDILFRSKFTDDRDQIDPENYIYEANAHFKSDEFQSQHKYALIKILTDTYKEYRENGCKFDIPDSIKQRTRDYLEASFDLLSWFKEEYQLSENKKSIVHLNTAYDRFHESDYYCNLSGKEKNKYKRSNFIEYFEKNIVVKKYFKKRYNNDRNVMKGWESIISIDSRIKSERHYDSD